MSIMRKSNEYADLFFPYMERVAFVYQKRGQYRTSETYMTTLNSFKRFRSGKDIRLRDFDDDLVESYVCYLKFSDLSPNTISFYLKHLRAIYNRAVDEGLTCDIRPFRRVSITIEKTAKRAMPIQTIRLLKEYDCSCSSSMFARDMFLFSFYTRGMSFVDIAFLRKKDLKDGSLLYRRKKTGQLLTIRWEPCMQEILETYKADDASPYLFSIIRNPEGDTRKQYQNAMFLINRHLKAIGRSLLLDKPLTMYCARHSWASIARDEGIPVSVISEGMGHDSDKTTEIYLASLNTGVIDNANRKILELL